MSLSSVLSAACVVLLAAIWQLWFSPPRLPLDVKEITRGASVRTACSDPMRHFVNGSLGAHLATLQSVWHSMAGHPRLLEWNEKAEVDTVECRDALYLIFCTEEIRRQLGHSPIMVLYLTCAALLHVPHKHTYTQVDSLYEYGTLIVSILPKTQTLLVQQILL